MSAWEFLILSLKSPHLQFSKSDANPWVAMLQYLKRPLEAGVRKGQFSINIHVTRKFDLTANINKYTAWCRSFCHSVILWLWKQSGGHFFILLEIKLRKFVRNVMFVFRRLFYHWQKWCLLRGQYTIILTTLWS